MRDDQSPPSSELDSRAEDPLLPTRYAPSQTPVFQYEGAGSTRRRILSRRGFLVATAAFVALAIGCLVTSPSSTGQHISSASCYVKGSLGLDASECSFSLAVATNGPSHYVPVWTSMPFPDGFVKKEIMVPEEVRDTKNITNVYAAMRTAVIDTHPWWGEEWRMLRIVGSIYDFPIDKNRHVMLSKFFSDNYDQYELRASVPANVSDPTNTETIKGQADFKDGRDIQFSFPSAPFNITSLRPKHGDTGDVAIPLTFELFFAGKLLESFSFELRQKWIPYSKMAICMKPLYGEETPSMFVEWREHHRMLGWPLVHWAHRHTGLSKVVEKLNKLTGGFDTFDHTPIFQETSEDIWDEYMTFNECYVKYKQASDFIGVWDLDEYAAPTPDKPWTGEWVEEYLTGNWSEWDPDANFLQMPMTWVDKGRFGNIPVERLLEVDPTLSKQDLMDMSELRLTTDGIQERHQEMYVKSLARTSKVRGANVHLHWPGPATWQDPAKLVIYHARTEQYGYPASIYHKFPINPSVVSHWKNLAERIRKLKLNSVYRVDAS